MAHSIRTRYLYKEQDYRSLIWALRQKNTYRYGALLEVAPDVPSEPTHLYARGIKWFRVPEGWVVLGTHQEKRWSWLQDLRDRPLHLTPFLVTWTSQRSPKQEAQLLKEERSLPLAGRLTLQLTGSYVKSKLALLSEMAHRHARVGTVTYRTPAEFVAAVNAVTRELAEASAHVWVWPDMTRGYNKEVQQLVRRYLVSAHNMPLQEAREYVSRWVSVWMPGRTVVEIAAARAAYRDHQVERAVTRRKGRKRGGEPQKRSLPGTANGTQRPRR